MRTKVFFLVAFIGIVAVNSSTAQKTILDQGSCGNSLTWVLTSDSVLTISGSGDMVDYYQTDELLNIFNTPWFSYKDTIATVVIGDSVTSIGNYAFAICKNLAFVNIPNSITRIGNGAFRACWGLTSVTIPNSVTIWGDFAFDACLGLSSVIIENGVTSIGERSFNYCKSLISVTIPNSVRNIGHAAFYVCESLGSVTLPDSLISIEGSTFSFCSSLTSITIPNSVTTIESHVFSSSGLTSITIPNNITSIKTNTFSRCDSLISVIIGSSVTIIEYFAFYNCSNLSSLVVHAAIPPVLLVAPYGGGGAFDGVPNTIPIYIPCGTYNDYRTAWSYFSNFIEPTTDTGFYFASVSQGKTYSDSNFTDLTQEGRYCITLQNDDGCDSVVCLYLTYDYTGMKQLQITDYELQVTSYEIYDVMGRNLTASLRGTQCRSNPEKTLPLSGEAGWGLLDCFANARNDVSVLPAGIYILKLYTNKGILTKKIVNL